MISIPTLSLRGKGFTLVELLISIGIFAFLGVALIGFLRSGLRTWRSGEDRRQVFETAQLVMEQIASDVECMCTDPGEHAPVDIRLLADYSPEGLPRIRFVRTIEGEIQDYVAREAGSLLMGSEIIDENDDYGEAYEGKLMPTGGMCEIAYALMPDTSNSSGSAYVLYRTVRSPIGTRGSVFLDSNLNQAGMNVFSRNILFFGFRFWTQHTNSWNIRKYCTVVNPKRNERSGPKDYWDSTRGLNIDPRGGTRREYKFYRGTRHDPSDDVFPHKIMIELVVDDKSEAAPGGVLAGRIMPESEIMRVSDGSKFPEDPSAGPCYVLVDREWIAYDRRHGDYLDGLRRGVRGTRAVSHEAGASVRGGRTFRMVLKPPGGREAWGE